MAGWLVDRLIAEAVITLARKGCKHPACGAEYAGAGSKVRHLRCADCPLDAVDRLADAYYGVQPDTGE